MQEEGTRTFIRLADFGEERKFPELGVSVVVSHDEKSKKDILIAVRELTPRETTRRPKGLTDRSRKR